VQFLIRELFSPVFPKIFQGFSTKFPTGCAKLKGKTILYLGFGEWKILVFSYIYG